MTLSTPNGSEEVWTMPESRVYHASRDCRALTRASRYYSPSLVPLAEATGARPYSGRRRPCSLCAKDGDAR